MDKPYQRPMAEFFKIAENIVLEHIVNGQPRGRPLKEDVDYIVGFGFDREGDHDLYIAIKLTHPIEDGAILCIVDQEPPLPMVTTLERVGGCYILFRIFESFDKLAKPFTLGSSELSPQKFQFRPKSICKT